MSPPNESGAGVTSLREHFRELYARSARFREDKRLAESLAVDAEPLLRALVSGCGQHPPDLHDAHALMARLGQRAAELAATASVVVGLPTAIVQALRNDGLALTSEQASELAVVAAEGYFAGHEQRSSRELRRSAADSQVAITLAPRVRAIFLAGQHSELDLGPTLELFARELLRDDIVSCLLDVTRLLSIDEELARVLGGFCVQAATLGVSMVIVARGSELPAWFASWAVSGPTITFADQYDRAQTQALAAAGLQMRARRRWARLFLPARLGLVR